MVIFKNHGGDRWFATPSCGLPLDLRRGAARWLAAPTCGSSLNLEVGQVLHSWTLAYPANRQIMFALSVKPPLTFRRSSNDLRLPPTSPSRQPAGQDAAVLRRSIKLPDFPAQKHVIHRGANGGPTEGLAMC